MNSNGKIKVIHIITSLGHGGAESALYRLVTDSSSRVEHTVVSLMGMGVYGQRLQEAGIAVLALDMPRGRVNVSGLRTLWHILKNTQPDIVQTWMYHSDLIGGVVSKIAGFHNISWGIHNFNLDKGVASNSTRWTAKLCGLLADWVPSRIVSPSVRGAFVHQEIGYTKEKFAVIPLGYNMHECSRDEAQRILIRKEWGITDSNQLIGCVARWDPHKDHLNLLNAINRISSDFPDAKCVLIGPEMIVSNSALQAVIQSSGIDPDRLILAGPSSNIPGVMSAIDLHVLSSLGEAFPNVVAEAMACETPCIVTDVGDSAIIVGDWGWVVPPADTKQLSHAIRNALTEMTDPSKWRSRGLECRKYIIDNFSMARMSAAYIDLWKQMLLNKEN